MPAISGSDKALMYSLAGVARAGAARVGYYPPQMFVETTQPGVSPDFSEVSRTVLKSDINIEQHLDGNEPDELTLTVRSESGAAFQAQPGAGIRVSIGTKANPIFTGRILKVKQRPRTATQRFPRWDVNCVDTSWEFNFRRANITKRYQMSASLAAVQYLADNAPNFTATVEGGLIDVDIETSLAETNSEFMSRLAHMAGAFWYLGADRSVHFYQTTPSATAPLDSTTKMWDFAYEDDLSQVRNLVAVIGGGPVSTADIAAEAESPTLPAVALHVENVIDWFASDGGQVFINGHIYSYAGYTDGVDPTLDDFAYLGTGNFPVAIPAGSHVRVFQRPEPVASQLSAEQIANLFEDVGLDGLIEHVIDDDRLDDDGAEFRATVEIAQYGQSFTTITFATRDPRFTPGTKVAVSIASIAGFTDVGEGGTGDFLVQTVTLHGSTADSVFPTRLVTLGSFRRNLSTLLARLGQVPGTPSGTTGI